MRPAHLLLLAAAAGLLAGCTDPPPAPRPTYTVVDPPEDGGGFAECAPSDAQPLAVPFRADAVDDAAGHPKGLHRLDASTFLWVWGAFNDSLREDRITRLNEVQVLQGREGTIHVCTRVEVAAPQEVDPAPRTFVVAARFHATAGMPAGPVRMVVNWVAGCLCDPLPRGNATADFS